MNPGKSVRPWRSITESDLTASSEDESKIRAIRPSSIRRLADSEILSGRTMRALRSKTNLCVSRCSIATFADQLLDDVDQDVEAIIRAARLLAERRNFSLVRCDLPLVQLGDSK